MTNPAKYYHASQAIFDRNSKVINEVFLPNWDAPVKGNRTPYDGDLVYWCTRMGQHPQANKVTATLLKRQKGKCTHCGLFFRDEDVIEVDHVIPKFKGGKSKYNNLQLLHRHCHDEKTAMDNFQQVWCQELEEEYLNDHPF